MATFVVAHGAWSAGWAWKKMRPLMRAKGHELFTPTYTGLGERAHLNSPAVDLETHIKDIVQVLEFEDLRNVMLIGHSYGGMVATGVADRARDRIKALIYLDSFAPKHGQSVLSIPPDRRDALMAAVKEKGEGWKLPPNPMPDDTSEADKAWAVPRRMMQSVKTFEQKLDLRHGELTLPRHYIYCKKAPPDDRFRQFLERAKQEGWGHDEMDASHNPHITAPGALMAILDAVARKVGG
jgi:pimeloyl-ACP methyl ester carboxylesterase